MKFFSSWCALSACIIFGQIPWVHCDPQWGVPAAADAANAIDLERYQAQALYHQQFPQQHHQQNHFFTGQQNFHQFPQRFNQAPQPQQQQPLPIVSAPAPVQGPSLTGPYSQTAPKSPPPKGMRRPKRRKLLKKKKKAARKVGQALPQGPVQPMGNLQNIRGPIMRQDSYPNYYYPGQRGVVQPKPEWGFWKWGKDNVSSFFG